MLLTTFDPFAAEFDRLTRRAFGPADAGRPLMRMDGIRREGNIELRFDLPGVDADSIEVTVDRGVLTVTAKRSQEFADTERPFIHERVMGSFTRRVRLSDAVDAEKIEAGYDRGVLTVLVPLTEQALPRKVEVKTEVKTGAKAEIAA
jgi:HSP20 family protein